jgi:hypothetical protein
MEERVVQPGGNHGDIATATILFAFTYGLCL